ncbi:hypothetical protein ABT404_44135 [Streptomyces hyaluromycini]|uniref:Integral membrane protein n=1 Tax=Streptomyces hyaluromycini TaxID=1377993 RepID=A0ABV1XBI8_9ACTN
MVGRIVRWGVALGFAAVWWWAVLRIAFTDGAGALEGTVAAGGWGLSLLPVNCVPRARAAGALGPARWRTAWRAPGSTRASPPLRSGAGSGPS